MMLRRFSVQVVTANTLRCKSVKASTSFALEPDLENSISNEEIKDALKVFDAKEKHSNHIYTRINDINNVDDEGMYLEEVEDKIDPICDISGLRPYHRNMVNQRHIPLPINAFFDETNVAELGARFGRFGIRSGVNPGALHPPKSEMASFMTEHETYFDYNRSMNDAKALQKKTLAQRKKIEDNAIAKLAKYPKILAEYEKSLEEKALKEEETQRVHKELTKQAMASIGFDVPENDPRVIKYIEDHYAEQERLKKKAMREAEKAEKEAAIKGLR